MKTLLIGLIVLLGVSGCTKKVEPVAEVFKPVVISSPIVKVQDAWEEKIDLENVVDFEEIK